MKDPDLKSADFPSSGLVKVREAFSEALRRAVVDSATADAALFFPFLSSLATDLGCPSNASLPAELISSALTLGRGFALTGRDAGLNFEQRFVLGCQLRDLFRQHCLPPPLSAARLLDYFDAFLLGVATESAHLQTMAFHKKLRAANHVILQERRRYYSVFKRMAEPAFIIDRDLRLLETNQAFDHFFKINGQDHIGKSCLDVLGDEFRASVALHDFLQVQRGVAGVEVDLVIGGEPRSIIVNGSFLGDINHEACGGIVILQDITERRAAERALRDSERHYRSLIENVPDVTWRANHDGDFVFVSPNVQKIYGYSALEMVEAGGSLRRSRIHPDDVDLVCNEFTLFFASHLPAGTALRRLLRQIPGGLVHGEEDGARNYDVQYRFQKKDGSWVWLHERASRIDEQDGEWYADGVSSDITDLKMAEAELERHHFRLAELVDERTAELQNANRQLENEIAVRRQTEQALMDLTTRLADSNQELEQFAHVASHDLKEPLMLIMAFSARLLKRYTAQLDDKGQEYLRRISSAAEHMRQLIEGFLALSQITSGARPYEEIDLTELVHEVLQSLEERIRECHARVEVGNLGRLGGDRVQLRQLFQNIIANALKYRKIEGQPLVVLRGGLAGDDFYEILIQDNGIGFAPQDAERIFRPLERLHSRREYEGTGMGLTTCQKIVARHGGEILAQGVPGQGATFIIRLPATLMK